jgi:ArsR family transcriptional regulator, arsenate/arsenite/antimonite-responsive transcriptional repressor
MDRSKALTALSALAHETRLDLIRLLMPQGDEGMAAGQIAQTLGLAAPRLSFHLSALEQAGLLRSRRVARNVFYCVDATGIGRTISYLLNDCCCEHPEVLAACAHGRRIRDCDGDQGAVFAVSGTEKT